MQFVKALVIGMGILILCGLALLVYGFMTQFGKGGDTQPSLSAPAPALGGFGETTLTLDAAEAIEAVIPSGNRIIIRTNLGDGRTRLRVLDVETGKETGSVLIQNAP